MFHSSRAVTRQFAADVLVVAATLCSFTSAYAQVEEPPQAESIGKLDFAAANLPEATVEVDLSQEMFRDLFGIGDAAIAGVVDALSKSPSTGDTAKATEIAAKQAEAARQIIQLARNVVREVHVRVYEDLPEGAEVQAIHKAFEEQLRAGKWETLARVRERDAMVRVAAVRDSGAVRGIFVTATENGKLVLANLVCDVSPDNVQKLTSAATKIGLENGLAKAIELKLQPRIVITGGERAPIPVPSDPPRPPEPARR
jgi:hypothetical protein